MLEFLSFLNFCLLIVFQFRLCYKFYQWYDKELFYISLFCTLLNLSLGVLLWVL